MSFVAAVTIIAKPGKASAILEHLKKIKKEVVENEAGTVKYDIAQNKENGEEILLWEQYVSMEAQATHREGKAYKAFKAEAGELVESLTIKTSDIVA